MMHTHISLYQHCLRKASILFIVMLVFSSVSFAQSVGINETGTNPDSSAILDVKSTTKGVLIPRMTSTERTNISDPAIGLMVFDITTNSFWYQNGNAKPGTNGWKEISATDADADPNNELQSLTQTNNTITLSNGGGSFSLLDGQQGPAGPQGPAGNDGADGNDGAQGPQGVPGVQGPAGNDGADGNDGNDGAQGPQGLAGPQGPAGNDGAAGTDGNDGADGADGAQGPQGIAGPQG
ncbi:MAG: hypothetical protein AB8F95_12295, partial [Bacteroidia bacterium]